MKYLLIALIGFIVLLNGMTSVTEATQARNNQIESILNEIK